MTAMGITIHASFLPHNDPEASLAFYRDTLGFEVRGDVGYGGMRWITVGPADQPGTSIVLHPPAADPGITDDERRTIVEMMAKGTYAGILLATADLDGTGKEPAHDTKEREVEMKIKIMSLHVDDQEKALRFYPDKLGFVKKSDVTHGDYRWLTVASAEEPEGTELQLALNDDPAAKAYQRAMYEQGQPAAMFYTDDVKA